MQCPSCGHDDIGEIRFKTIGSGMRFNFCRYCEHRWWKTPSRDYELADVLRAATVFAKAS